VTEPPRMTFAWLLRQLRASAGLTQEELAGRARLSPRSISDLERGIHLTARRETAHLLANALGLTDSARVAFESAAQGRPAADPLAIPGLRLSGVAAATRTLPRDISSFTGRETELAQLMSAVTEHVQSGWVAAIYAIGGLAGIGKTAFAVHAAHLLAPRFPDGQIFLPLHGHTPGQLPVDPVDALASLLQTAGMAPQQIPSGLEPRTRLWRDYLVGKQMLLLLDDAAGHEQVRPLLPGTVGSVVLVTSRRHLTALEDAQAISLETLEPESAADLLIRVAGRPDLATDRAVREIAGLCGCLPLAVGMLARQLHHHPTWTAVGLATDLAAARDRLGLMQAENLSVAAAFDLSYQDLTPGQQRLFRRLGLHPGVDIDAHAAAALDDTELAVARRHLEGLYDQYLLTEPARGRYRFHDLISAHARSRAASDPAEDRASAVNRLLDYYLRGANAADRYLIRRTPAAEIGTPVALDSQRAGIPAPANREQAVGWMNSERLNLHAAAGYAATHDHPRHAVGIATSMHGYLRSQGHWVEALTLYRTALSAAYQLGDQLAQAGALADLGDIQTLSGDYRASADTHEKARVLYRGLGDRLGEANALNKLATVQQAMGNQQSATVNVTTALALHRDLGDRLGEANDLNQLGVVQYETGDYRAAAVSQVQALELRRQLGDRLGEATALFRLGAVQQATGDYPAAIVSLTLALSLHRESGYRFGEATVLGQLCGVQQATGKIDEASVTQREALTLYRILGYPRGEAEALRHLGAIQHATNDDHSAAGSYAEALELYHGIGFRLGEAEVLNDLGEMSLASAQSGDARSYHEQALAIAKEISSLPEQARALEGIGRNGRPGDPAAEDTRSLRDALVIYEQIGSRRAQRIKELLDGE
jgi:tetratricopeptide (TPR) repeat protein/transcriptional regulator with XRE-family HTH domain